MTIVPKHPIIRAFERAITCWLFSLIKSKGAILQTSFALRPAALKPRGGDTSMTNCICHFSVKSIQRSAGRSVTASVAYRDGEKIKDERTGETFDYTRRDGVEFAGNIVPDGVTRKYTTAELWNAAEQSEKRVNSSVGREYVVALPVELSQRERQNIAADFAAYLVDTYGVAANVAVHLPGKNGDERNYHAHIMTSTRVLTPEGFGAKTRVLDDKATRATEVKRIREKWAELGNQYLERAGSERRMNPRSFAARGIEREPEIHLGPAASAIERRRERWEEAKAEGRGAGPEPPTSARGDRNREIRALNAEIAEHSELGREITGEIAKQREQREQRERREAAAKQEAERQRDAAKQAGLQEGRTAMRASYDAWKREKAERQQREEQQRRREEQQRKAEREKAAKAERGRGRGR